MLSVTDDSIILNFDYYGVRSLGFLDDSMTLNFELKDYDQFHPKYQIVMDFMELYSYADIFHPGPPVDIVIIDIIDTGPQVGDIKKDEDVTPTVVIDII